jgi:hypothetical protein
MNSHLLIIAEYAYRVLSPAGYLQLLKKSVYDEYMIGFFNLKKPSN